MSDPATTHPSATGKPTAPAAIAALVWGVIGLFLFGLIVGWVAINYARAAKRQIAESDRYEGEGLATAAMVLGALDIVVWSVMLLLKVGAG